MIKGMDIILYDKVQIDKDEFNHPVYEEQPVTVENVLVSPSTSQEMITSTSLYSKKAVYTIAIPKGDTHIWEDRIVEFFGKKWKTFGFVTKGIEANIPLSWNTKIQVEAYE